ncbi:sigma 54-interacting transcriptional regulator [Lihuaxuella thermophila]|uniref:Transcriptional regulator containing an AAA-type ATPase domain and a DNA-binding domain n=1 Tax=Lihuaxuella thermophila TaxID=1173111 RepID=A0A1H8CF07_9BACL|nr:sigma 54-interacting transcriptional regulator [Lihuaxuella thermophila]SEM92858.1 Transcriptional regulator containing an AAA-type ATPase domain and a DNA-binding domain [Lihuaxuella thermophila]
MKKINWVEQLIHRSQDGVTAQTVAAELNLDRSTASRYLNELVKNKKARKIIGRPVRYISATGMENQGSPSPAHPPSRTPVSRESLSFPSLIGVDQSLQTILEEALAALFYPPNGLPIMLTGETGTGKSYLAKTLYQIAISDRRMEPDAPFIAFNCAEYAQNPELLMAQLFGVKKGAYTGAQADKESLVEKADGGILFLDEIHRLPPSGQEMLFYLMDQGTYRRLGETGAARRVNIRMVAATTESPQKALLPTLYRRFSVKLTLPPLRKRGPQERERLLQFFLDEEARKMHVPLRMAPECRTVLLRYDCPGNIGQLKSDVQIACARAFLRHLNHPNEDEIVIRFEDLPHNLREHKRVSQTVKPLLSGKERPKDLSENPFPNIYDECRRRKEALLGQNASPTEIDQEMQEIVSQYILSLLESAERNEKQFIPDNRELELKLAEILHRSVQELNIPVSSTQLTALNLHIQSYLKRSGSSSRMSSLPPANPKAVYKEIAQKIADDLEQGLGISLPDHEIDLISLFLTAHKGRKSPKQRLIATVCLTGEGSAVSLEDWLKENLPKSDQDVAVKSVQIDPMSRRSLMLEYLKEEFDLIAVVGTVPPDLDDVYYLPVWELYQPHGFQRLVERLNETRPVPVGKDGEPKLSWQQIPDLILQGLLETVVHYNPRRFVEIINKEMSTFRQVFQWDPERELGCWMHLGVYTDRLLKTQLDAGRKQEEPARPIEGTHPPSTQIFVWKKLLQQLEGIFHLEYPTGTAEELARLSSAAPDGTV